MGSVRVAEHLKVKKFPAIPGPEGERVTWLVLNAVPKFTGHAMEENQRYIAKKKRITIMTI